jgi:hypothetical protein
MILIGIGLILVAFLIVWIIISDLKNQIRGLENTNAMKDQRIDELCRALENDDIDNIHVGNVRKIGGEWSIIKELEWIYEDDFETVKQLRFTCEKADMSDYTEF